MVRSISFEIELDATGEKAARSDARDDEEELSCDVLDIHHCSYYRCSYYRDMYTKWYVAQAR